MDDKTYSVYIHTAPNGKKYVGLTSQQPPEKRFANGHGYIGNPLFYAAIMDYGWDKIRHEIIETNLTAEEASKMEIDLIKEYDTTNPEHGYNRSKGGISHIDKEEYEDFGYPEYFIDGNNMIPKYIDEMSVIHTYDFFIDEIERIKSEYENKILKMQYQYYAHLQGIYDYSEHIENFIFSKESGALTKVPYAGLQCFIHAMADKHMEMIETQSKKVYGEQAKAGADNG